jgi:hypothetical protein
MQLMPHKPLLLLPMYPPPHMTHMYPPPHMAVDAPQAVALAAQVKNNKELFDQVYKE